MRFVLALLFFGIALTGCRERPDYREEELFHDYQITGEEGADQVSILVQFRERNSYGPTVELIEGSGIELDGIPLELNKETRSGPVYVASRSVNEFDGSHQLVFTDSRGKKWKQELVFSMFNLVDSNLFKRPVDSAGFEIVINAVWPVKRLRVLMTDTSYAGKEVDKKQVLTQNKLTITRADLTGLKPGPVQLELVSEYQRIMEGKARLRGALNVAYTVRREFLWEPVIGASRRP